MLTREDFKHEYKLRACCDETFKAGSMADFRDVMILALALEGYQVVPSDDQRLRAIRYTLWDTRRSNHFFHVLLPMEVLLRSPARIHSSVGLLESLQVQANDIQRRRREMAEKQPNVWERLRCL